MMFVLARTNLEGQALRAKELTSCDSNEEKKLVDEEEEEKEVNQQVEKGFLGSCATKEPSDLVVWLVINHNLSQQ